MTEENEMTEDLCENATAPVCENAEAAKRTIRRIPRS